METLQELIKYGYNNYKEKDFIHYKENNVYKPITFERTINDIIYLAEKLLSLNLKDKKIIIVGENSYEWLISWTAVITYVGVALPIDKMWTCYDIDNILNDIDVSAIIYTNFNLDTINKVKEMHQDIKYINIHEEFNEMIKDGQKINKLKEDKFNFKRRTNTEICEIRYSSGTSSFPKAIMMTEKNLLSNMENMIKRAPMTNNDSVLLFLPLHHGYTSITAFLYSFYTGLQNYIGSGLNSLVSDLKLAKPTILTGVPLIYYKFLENIDEKKKSKIDKIIKISNFLRKIGIDLRKVFFKEFYNAFGGNIKYWFCAGSYLKTDVKKFYSDLGIRIQCAYGLTECSSLVALEYYNKKDVGSAGEILENQEVKILNPNEEGVGEIIIRGNQVTPGYYNSELNKKAFKDGYFYTGDIGRIDDNNNIYITGRKKRVIVNSGGKNIYPDDIEEIIKKNSEIQNVKIFEKDDEICAIIITELDANEVDKFIQEINSKLAKYMKIQNYKIKKLKDIQLIK